MKEHDVADLRNVAFVGHGGSGKTSLCEAFLYNGKATTRLGKVEDGTSIFDHSPEEIQRKITIALSVGHFEWKDCLFNVIDTPGYADFVGDVKASLAVVDSAILTMRAAGGVEVGTVRMWDFIEANSLPAFLCVTMMDKEHADFWACVQGASDAFSKRVLPVILPIGAGESFSGVVDVVSMKAFTYSDHGKFTEQKELPDEVRQRAEEAREKLIDGVAEGDDALLEKYLENGTLEAGEIVEGLQKSFAKGDVIPAVAVSGHRGTGVQHLLDLLSTVLPSPSDRGPVEGVSPGSDNKIELKPQASEPFCGLVFKTVSEPHVGELSLVRVFSGKLQSGSDAYNSTKGKAEKIGQLFRLQGKDRKEVASLGPGEFGAAVKLRDTSTGDTLCSQAKRIKLVPIEFPAPVLSEALKPKAKGDEEKIANGLSRLKEEDPTFTVVADPELRQTLLNGMGELHLEVIIGKLKDRFGVEVDIVKPKVPYRETIRGKAEVQGRYKKQTGGRGQYGDVWIKMEPRKRGEGFEFENLIVGGAIPSKYIPAVQKGVEESSREGVLAGYPMVDFKISLFDGSFHTVDSSDLAFKIAGSMAFKKAALQAKPILLEPIMEVEVTVPDECMGDVMGDLSSKRGKILGMDSRGTMQQVRAFVPQAELYKYSTNLRSLTQGRGSHTAKFASYEEVPRELTEKVVADSKQKEE
ncbi:MAG: elongation factor G [Candidatus Eiseniibacteriota bacterium]|nr:MAG: elongation factor G [Candidatus Eisenbacteria bacterium]